MHRWCNQCRHTICRKFHWSGTLSLPTRSTADGVGAASPLLEPAKAIVEELCRMRRLEGATAKDEEGATLRLPSKLKLRNPLESSIRIEEWI